MREWLRRKATAAPNEPIGEPQPLDVLRERIGGLSKGQALAFVVMVAERLMTRHEALPRECQAEFTLGLRPTLDALWRAIAQDHDAYRTVSDNLGRYYLSPYSHNDGQDGPNDADEDAAAAVLYAAEYYMWELHEFALWCSQRGVDGAFFRAEAELDRGDHGDPDQAMSDEVAHQLRDLDVVARRPSLKGVGPYQEPGLTEKMIAELRAAATA
jgi:hypothetical protein